MKYLIVFSVIAAVASAASYLKPAVAANEVAEIQEIIAAINSPSTDPATAAALEQLLLDTVGISASQPEEPSPISVGPAIIDFPLPDGGAVTAEQPAVVESPVLVPAPVIDATPAAAAEVAPLVQIILNINQASSEVAAAPVAPAPVEAPVIAVDPVHVVDEAVNVDSVVPTPVQVVEVAPEPVQVVEVAPEPVQVVEVVPEPIQVVEIAPAPVVTLPDILN